MSKLKHFEEAQEGPLGYETALDEIRSGRKQSDWMLYIFPRLKGLERGYDAEYYGIESLYEARQYMEHGDLGRRLRDITYVVLMHDTMFIEDIMDGWEDAERFRASMTLFDIICPGEYFGRCLDVFFDDIRDERTLAKVEKERSFLYGPSAFEQLGISSFSERGYFEGGVVESDEIPTDVKLPTVLSLVLKGNSMLEMVHHYLFHKDFSHYRLSGVESRLEWYRNRLLHELRAGADENGLKVLHKVSQRLERMDFSVEFGEEIDMGEAVDDAAKAFDYVVFECGKDVCLEKKMTEIARSIELVQ